MPTDGASSKVLTLLFTDLAGSTSLKTEKGDKVAGDKIDVAGDKIDVAGDFKVIFKQFPGCRGCWVSVQ